MKLGWIKRAVKRALASLDRMKPLRCSICGRTSAETVILRERYEGKTLMEECVSCWYETRATHEHEWMT